MPDHSEDYTATRAPHLSSVRQTQQGNSSAELAALQKELSQLREENKKAQAESERLLHLMQMSQEEQFAKDKTIKELQE